MKAWLAPVLRVYAQTADDATWLTWLLGFGSALTGYFFPDESSMGFLQGLAILLVADSVTGFMAAWKERRVSSAGWWKVGAKICAYFGLIAVVAVAAHAFPLGENALGAGISGIMLFMIARESVSVCENVVRLGVQIPFGITERLKSRLGMMERQDGAEG